MDSGIPRIPRIYLVCVGAQACVGGKPPGPPKTTINIHWVTVTVARAFQRTEVVPLTQGCSLLVAQKE